MSEESLTIIPILKRIPLFENLQPGDHEEVVKNIKLQFYPHDYRIFSEGDIGELLYIIKTGKVRISRLENGNDLEVAMLAPGDFFGEMALFSREARNASAVVLEDAEIFTLEHKDFLDLITKNHDIAGRISDKFIKRVQENTKKLTSQGGLKKDDESDEQVMYKFQGPA